MRLLILHERFNLFMLLLREWFNQFPLLLHKQFNLFMLLLHECFDQFPLPLRERFNPVYGQGCGKAARAAMLTFASQAVSLLTRPEAQTPA